MRKSYTAAGATAVGPYSHAVDAGDLVFFSGQTPMDSATGKLVEGDIAAQTEQCFKNLFAVLAAAGMTEANVVKANVFLTNMADFAAMNAVYATKFSAPYPARSTVAVAGLPVGAQVEIELIARKG
jgi:2-iminobutanoate/2-iminopropanoate deaminase